MKRGLSMPYSAELRFRYRNPTRVLFGDGSVSRVASEVESLGGTRALVVTDEGLATTGLPDRVRVALGDKCVGVFSGVKPDTGVAIVHSGVEMARQAGADVLVSVGGGSTIDTAKAMSVVLKWGGRLPDYFGARIDGPLASHVAIPTTSGTGSEVTRIAVIKHEEQEAKHAILSDHIFPDVAILDPQMTMGMPPLLTASTGMDAMTHAVEGLASTLREPFADALNLHAIRLIVEYLPRCVEHGEDATARGQQMIAAALAGMGFGNSLVGIVHAAAHVLGARYGVPHGVANGVLLAHGMRYNLDACPDRYALVAEAMGARQPQMDDGQAAEAAVEAMTEFVRAIGHPERLRDAGVPSDTLKTCAEATLAEGSMGTNPRPGDLDGVLKMLEAAW